MHESIWGQIKGPLPAGSTMSSSIREGHIPNHFADEFLLNLACPYVINGAFYTRELLFSAETNTNFMTTSQSSFHFQFPTQNQKKG